MKKNSQRHASILLQCGLSLLASALTARRLPNRDGRNPARMGTTARGLIRAAVLASMAIQLLFPESPRTPIEVKLSLSRLPQISQSATATIVVSSIRDAPDTLVELDLPPGVSAGTLLWRVNLTAGVPVTLNTSISIGTAGNLAISARARKQVAPGEIWGDMATVALHVGLAGTAPTSLGWQMNEAPVAEQVRTGTAQVLSMAPTAFNFADEGLQVEGVGLPLPRTTPSLSAGISPIATAGNITLRGRWEYQDRSSVPRGIDQQLIEVRRGTGAAFSPPVYCYTAFDGSYSCSLPDPGSTVRVWVRSWTNFNTPTGAERLGVFSGPEVSGGCGSDAIVCSYPVQTGEINCAGGLTCDVGTWRLTATVTGEPGLGAHQMTQDLIRSWKRIFFDAKHGGRVSAGPGRINYPVPSGHGTHAHISGANVGWISIEPPNQQSGDVTNHEYGHMVMYNLWSSFATKWPTGDCPSPHYIQLASGPGCAYSEGFANFWTWYSNEFYDGSSNAANYGPVFNWPGGASTNLETRPGYETGDRVEGNVAGALGDWLDLANDGPGANPDIADRLSHGVAHIWHTISTNGGNNFAAFWSQYRTQHGASCLERDALEWNTINYTSSGCTAPPAPVLVSPAAGATGVSLNPTLSWNASAGATSYDLYFGTSASPGFVRNQSGVTYAPGPLQSAKAYYWYVVARNSAGRTSSSARSFTTIGAGAIALSPTSLSYAVTLVGTTTALQVVTIKNIGTAAVSVTSIALGGTDPGDFSRTHNCPASLAKGASCTASVAFKPAAKGTRAAALVVTHSAPGSPHKVSLTGTGTVVKLSPASLTFAARAKGTTSAAQTATVTNAGSGALTISGIALAGANPSDFILSHNCPSSVAAGRSCGISVKFKPVATGSRKAAVNVSHNGGGSPSVVTLSGTGQ